VVVRRRFLISVGLTDLGLLAGAVVVASLAVFDDLVPWVDELVGLNALPMVVFLVGFAVTLSFVTMGMTGPGVPRPSYGRATVIVLGSMALTGLAVLATRSYYSRPFMLSVAVLWGVGAIGQRAVRRMRPWTERIAVITHEKALVDDLDHAPHVEVIQVIDPTFDGEIDLLPAGTLLAVDIRTVLSERVAQYVSSCNIAGYAVEPFTAVYEQHTGRIPLVHLAEGWEISTPLLNGAPWLGGKRTFDLALTVLTAPAWIVLGGLVALFIKSVSPGPVLFRQERIGLDGRHFTMVKFRTMRTDAEADGPRFAAVDDERFIRGGRFLRRSRLDEIPQLVNVLQGEMSLVGPRAEQVPFVRDFRREIPFYDQRHLVRPGLTGWAQVNYRYADDLAETVEKLTYDLYYVKHMSPMLDLQIIWKSIWIVATGKGAR
jgi:lipopolysaccharide/colanic/teichoic acid biosynthesis glycosyltransferase